MFSFIKKSLKKVYTSFTSKLQSLFGAAQIDDDILQQLQKIMLEADLGVQTTKSVIEQLRVKAKSGDLQDGAALQKSLQDLLQTCVDLPKVDLHSVILLVGINGSGKTTFAGKLANYYKSKGKKVLLVAADTFRAAAVEQLQGWGNKLGIDVVQGEDGQDPAAVVFKGCQKFKEGNYDILLIDTAGRLQTKTNLMQELTKIKKVVNKQLFPIVMSGVEGNISTLLTVDAMLGQNSLVQAKEFNDAVDLDGVILTKMDGTSKGGIVIAIAQQLKLPVTFISFGEQVDDMKLFDAKGYVEDLING